MHDAAPGQAPPLGSVERTGGPRRPPASGEPGWEADRGGEPPAPVGLTADGVLSLQRTAGNRAATALVDGLRRHHHRPRPAGPGPVGPPAARVEHNGRTTTAVRPTSSPSFATSAPTARPVQRLEVPDLGLGDISLPDLGDILRQVPGYDLLTLVVGFDPVAGRPVEVTPSALVRAVMGLAPGGAFVHDRLVDLGVLQEVSDLIATELAANELTSARLERDVERAWDEVDLTPRLDVVSDAIAVVERYVRALVGDVERVAGSLVDRVLAVVKDAAIGQAERLLAESESARRTWDLARAVLRHDPLRGEAVEATTEQIIEKFLLLIGREAELEQMRAQGTLAATAEWLDTQLAQFTGIIAELATLVGDVLDALSFEQLPQLPQNLVDLARRGLELVGRIAAFAATVADKVLQLIKDALLGALAEHADAIPGFELLTVVLARNPLNGKAVARTGENLVRGFFALLPGGRAQYDELAQTGVIAEAGARIDAAVEALGITWDFVVGLFNEIWASLAIEDLAAPEAAFERVVARFQDPIDRLFRFVQTVVEEVTTLVLRVMGFPSDLLGRIVTNALAAFERIQQDPIAFFENLLVALKLGLGNFFDNILRHLSDGLAGWLLRGLESAGVRLPDQLDLESVLDLVLQVLGITVENLWAKLADRIGPERVELLRGAVDRLSGIWGFVRDVQERGLTAIWEYISDKISGLWDLLLQKAQDWIMTEIVEAVVTKLLSMLDPTGIMAVVNSFIAFFRAVQSAIEYLREILEIVDRYVATIADIAAGTVEPAAAQLEGGLAASIPVAIGFLANQVGLGDVAGKIREIIASAREVVEGALDWLLDRAMEAGSAVLGALGIGGEQAATPGPAAAGDGAAAAAAHVADVAAGAAGSPGAADQVRATAEAAGDQHLLGEGRIEVTNLPAVQRTETVVEEAPQPVPEAEQLTPRHAAPTAPASAAEILTLIQRRMPTLLASFAQDPASERAQLDQLEGRFRGFMVGKRERPLTAAEHAEGLEILTPARSLSRRYYDAFRNYAWRSLRSDDELADLVGAEGSGARWGSSERSSLQIRVEVTRADGSTVTEFRAVDFEHITRVTDQPFRRHSDQAGGGVNLTPMLADLNRYVNEAIRNELGAHMFGDDDIEQFIVQHQLYPAGSPARRQIGFQPGPAAGEGDFVDLGDLLNE